MEKRTTNIWIIIDEEKLEILKDRNGNPKKFRTCEKANQWASDKLNMWAVFNVHFVHHFIHHKAN